ncbi:MAG TPA: PorV/PorQ family protein [Candidatus Marinimicrobia bacterium]|nr:PorV/PorQ family protein [Candidatus Neomarinimicrobiota bacterium]
MIGIKRTLIIMACSACLYGQITGSVSNVGTTAASFLDIGIGARSLSMGGAFVAVADDPTALYWNPAGIVNIQTPTAHFFHSPWLADIRFNHSAVVVPIDRSSSFGFFITSVSMDEMQVRTVKIPQGTGEYFSVSNVALAGSYARRLTDRFSFGFNIKYIQEKIWHMNAGGLAVDLGSLFVTKNSGVRIGMSVSNFGGKSAMEGYDTEVDYDVDETMYGNNDKIDAHLNAMKWPLPLVFRAGVSKDLIQSDIYKLTLAGDAVHPNNNVEYLNLGFEYIFRDILALRGGQAFLGMEDSKQGLTLGLGLNYQIPRGPRITLDYAYRSFGVFENISGYSLNLIF